MITRAQVEREIGRAGFAAADRQWILETAFRSAGESVEPAEFIRRLRETDERRTRKLAIQAARRIDNAAIQAAIDSEKAARRRRETDSAFRIIRRHFGL